jgi:hypothetical protein
MSLNMLQGTLNGESQALRTEGFSIKYKPAPEPHRLLMPNPIRTVRYVCVRDTGSAL